MRAEGYIVEDLRHFMRTDRSPTMFDLVRLISTSPGFQVLAVYRMRQWIRRERDAGLSARSVLLPVQALLQAIVRWAYDIHIDSTAEIGPGLYIGHFGGIRLIGCTLGAGCSIQQQVQLEPCAAKESGPVVGDRVWIGAHARVRGSYRIGDGATIAAGSVVTADVVPKGLWMGAPGRLISSNYGNSKFL